MFCRATRKFVRIYLACHSSKQSTSRPSLRAKRARKVRWIRETRNSKRAIRRFRDFSKKALSSFTPGLTVENEISRVFSTAERLNGAKACLRRSKSKEGQNRQEREARYRTVRRPEADSSGSLVLFLCLPSRTLRQGKR